jgi:hypothetical protein
VLAHLGRKPGGNRNHQWLCRCDCGEVFSTITGNLRGGATKSCGCLQREKARAAGDRTRTHGMCSTSTYAIWDTMIARCHRPASKDYARYGAAGITVCDSWRQSFSAFLADMGERPPGLTLDRIDGALGYSPNNCRWATYAEQSRNSRIARMVSMNGKTQCITDWCREIGIAKGTVSARMAHGWSVEDALTKPINPNLRRERRLAA